MNIKEGKWDNGDEMRLKAALFIAKVLQPSVKNA